MENHGYSNCVASGQRSVAVYMLSRVVHDDKSLVVSPVVCMLTSSTHFAQIATLGQGLVLFEV